MALAVGVVLLLGGVAIQWLVGSIVLAAAIAAFDGTLAREGIAYFRNLAGLLVVGGIFAVAGVGPLLLILTGFTLIVGAVAGGACSLLRNPPLH